jgi:hypothetical protein
VLQIIARNYIFICDDCIRWAAIASYLPQRTDNDIIFFWNTHLKRKMNKDQSSNDEGTKKQICDHEIAGSLAILFMDMYKAVKSLHFFTGYV